MERNTSKYNPDDLRRLRILTSAISRTIWDQWWPHHDAQPSDVIHGCHVPEGVSRVWDSQVIFVKRVAISVLYLSVIHVDSLERGKWSVCSDPQVLPPRQSGTVSLVQIFIFFEGSCEVGSRSAVVLCLSRVELPPDVLRLACDYDSQRRLCLTHFDGASLLSVIKLPVLLQ